MKTPLKKFLKVVRLISKIFLVVDSEKNHEYTFKKNSLKSFSCFELFLSSYGMIFKNLGLVDLSREFDLFIWQTASHTLLKNFALSIDRKNLKVALHQIYFLLC